MRRRSPTRSPVLPLARIAAEWAREDADQPGALTEAEHFNELMKAVWRGDFEDLSGNSRLLFGDAAGADTWNRRDLLTGITREDLEPELLAKILSAVPDRRTFTRGLTEDGVPWETVRDTVLWGNLEDIDWASARGNWMVEAHLRVLALRGLTFQSWCDRREHPRPHFWHVVTPITFDKIAARMARASLVPANSVLVILAQAFWRGEYANAYFAARRHFVQRNADADRGRTGLIHDDRTALDGIDDFEEPQPRGPLGYRRYVFGMLMAERDELAQLPLDGVTGVALPEIGPGERGEVEAFEELAEWFRNGDCPLKDCPPAMLRVLENVAILPADLVQWASEHPESNGGLDFASAYDGHGVSDNAGTGQAPAPPLKAGSRGARRFSQTALESWYAERVTSWPHNRPPPSRDEDWEAAKEKFPNVPRESVRDLRRLNAPDDWKKKARPKGRRKTGRD